MCSLLRHPNGCNLDYTALAQSFGPLVASSSASSLAHCKTKLQKETIVHKSNLIRSPRSRASFNTTHDHQHHHYHTTNNEKGNSNMFIAKIISSGCGSGIGSGGVKNGLILHANSFHRSSSYTPNTLNEYKIFKAIKEGTANNGNKNANANGTYANESLIDEFYQIPVIDYSNKDFVITRL